MAFKFMLKLSFTAALFHPIFVQKNLGENKHDSKEFDPSETAFFTSSVQCAQVNILTLAQLTR